MTGKSERSRKTIVRIIIFLIIIACIGYAGYHFYSAQDGGNKADETIKTLQTIIPGLGMDIETQSGLGRDPLAAVYVDGIDIVGVIEIPSLDVMAPVTGKDLSEEYFATWLDGSPVQGHFSIAGGRDDVFRKIAGLKPGDKAVFTDIDGVRYVYSVSTQYHLKKWDVGDNDLLLCYETDSDTYFVVGCSRQ